MIEAIADRAFVPAADAVARGDIPGALLGIVTRDGARAIRLAGHAALSPTTEKLTTHHWFDLASLTKVIATTPAILRLVDAGRITLDTTLAEVIPDLRQYDVDGALERRLTIGDCLTHSTHLPAVEPIYTYGDDPARLRAFVLQCEWRAGPPVYSDINFILLGIVIERLGGLPPLSMGLSYSPPEPIVSTECCTWRRRMLRGEVHDENAFALGGSPGHAGLFGTADGILSFASGLLDGSGASPAAIAHMRTRYNGNRTAGWEARFPGWPGGGACSANTIGHTGFTGTGLWIDFDRGLAWTLLTNRVHPTRHRDSGIFTLRPATGDAVIAAFDRAAGSVDPER